MVAEARRFPEAAKAFYVSGPARAAVRLAELIEERAKRGEIEVRDSRLAAQFFVGMVRGNIQLEVVLGVREAPDDDEMETIVTAAVDTFLHGLAPQGSAGSRTANNSSIVAS